MKKLQQRLNQLKKQNQTLLLQNGLIGLEKESLRVNRAGSISQTPHPYALGSALCHPKITTDYSEALLEFITAPSKNIPKALACLRDTQQFVYNTLDNEHLWATSMPCVMHGDDGVPIAQYGCSNAGRMKTVYREGLGHRYGKSMQVIAGVHFNYSVPEAFWPVYQRMEMVDGDLQAFINDSYMGMIRNLQRFGWLIPYLFGASPAVCKSFLKDRSSSSLQPFDETTYYEPFATSLRMGDIGYQNSKEEGVGIKVCYDNLDAYVNSLSCAISTPSSTWKEIDVAGEYRQLNSNILQIENEYYSTVRPKQVLAGMEKPTVALAKRGIQYVELRSLDVNAYDHVGVSEPQLYFVEAFMLLCLLADSPVIDQNERKRIDENLINTAHRGRDPGLMLFNSDKQIQLRDWANEILDAMTDVCEILDGGDPDGCHTTTLMMQKNKVENPDLTPSARMLAEMREQEEGFYQFGERMSARHRRYFLALPEDPDKTAELTQLAEESHRMQKEIEDSDTIPFALFLERYFDGTLS